jgi:thiamine-phosphate pyrophosphorylase
VIPKLHLVTDDGILRRGDFLRVAEGVMKAGGERIALHIRGPRSAGGFLFGVAQDLTVTARRHGTLLLVNDRIDVALALGLAGVHLGQRSLRPRTARRMLGPAVLLGLSVHGPEEVAAGHGYVGFLVGGTAFPTPSHPGRPGGGATLIRALVDASSVPVLAIGGITPRRVAEMSSTGAHGVAVRGSVWDAPDPAEAVGVFLEGLKAEASFGQSGPNGARRERRES